jgi:predicted HTH domain antitoxin
MLIAIHDDALRGLDLTEDQARLDLALGLFIDQRVTLGRGAEIARMTQSDFLKELGRRGIPVHYDVEDFRADLRTLESLKAT